MERTLSLFLAVLTAVSLLAACAENGSGSQPVFLSKILTLLYRYVII
jgi:hypothetical protein